MNKLLLLLLLLSLIIYLSSKLQIVSKGYAVHVNGSKYYHRKRDDRRGRIATLWTDYLNYYLIYACNENEIDGQITGNGMSEELYRFFVTQLSELKYFRNFTIVFTQHHG
jgi:hypothetical protein